MGDDGRFFARLARFIVRRRRAVLRSCLAAILLGLCLAPIFQSQLLGVGYDTPGTDSYKADQILEDRTGFTERITLVLESDRYRTADAPFQRAIQRATAAVKDVDDDLLVIPPGQPGGGAISEDGRAYTATVALKGDAGDRQDASHDLQEAIDDALPPGISGGVTGDSPLLADLIHVEEMDMVKAEVVGLPIALVILLVAFGSGVAAGLPLVLGLSGLFVSFGCIAGLMLFMDFNSFAESLMAMIGIAIGIDYSLLIVRRWRDERQRSDPETAMVRTLTTAGRTVAFSGAILTTSLIPLVITDLPFFGDTAIAVMTVVVVEVILCLTLLPALLLKLGPKLDRWQTPAFLRPKPRTGPSRWQQWARAVMRRPVPVLAAGTAILLLAAVPALGLKTGIDLNARAMKGEESVKALTSIEERFPAAALAPVEVLLTGDTLSVAQAQLDTSRILKADGRLAEVQSNMLDNETMLVSAIPKIGVDSEGADDLIRDLRTKLDDGIKPGVEPLVTGVTAETVDYSDETNDVTPFVIAASLVLAFFLLLCVFRSPLLAVKAILMNLLSIGAAFGLTVLVFQEGLGEEVLGFTSPGYIQAWMPLTLFMMLFGLSMDYEVFMVSRIREEWEKTGDTTEAVANGLAHTGGVITSAALIMVAIFASFLLTSIPEMKQMGFGLAAAVLIDATIVRAALVPAFMRVAGRWNWWIPPRLERILPRLEH